MFTEKFTKAMNFGKVFLQTTAGKVVAISAAVAVTATGVTVGVVNMTHSAPASSAVSAVSSSASSAVSSAPAVIDVQNITLDNATAEVTVGKTIKLNATISPADATSQVLTWTSSDSSIATVGADGTVTGVIAGTANITVVSNNNIQAVCKVAVLAVKTVASSSPTSSAKPQSSSPASTTSTAPATNNTPATQPAGTSGFAFNESLSNSFNSISAENKNTAFYSTLYNDTLNAIKNHNGPITAQGGLDDEVGQLTTKYGNMTDMSTMAEYTHNGIGYSVENCWYTVTDINSGDAQTLYNTAKSNGFFSQIQGMGSYFTDVPSERFTYTYIFYNPDSHTNKLIRFVWYVMQAPTRVS